MRIHGLCITILFPHPSFCFLSLALFCTFLHHLPLKHVYLFYIPIHFFKSILKVVKGNIKKGLLYIQDGAVLYWVHEREDKARKKASKKTKRKDKRDIAPALKKLEE